MKLRFFAGMTLAEAGVALGLSDRTADRHWRFAGPGWRTPWPANRREQFSDGVAHFESRGGIEG
jgi:hypothetical protein